MMTQRPDSSRSDAAKSSEVAKERIRQDILMGRLLPGQRVKVAEVAERYGIGQMPVREALLQLEGEGLLDNFAHRGAVIRPVDAKFIYNMYEIRRVLEVMLVGTAARRFRADDAARLRIALARHEATVATGDPAAMLSANTAFHSIINAVGDNADAERIITRGWDLVHALRLRFGFGASRLAAIMAEHRALLDALSARDVERSVATADRHCTAARDDLLAQLA